MPNDDIRLIARNIVEKSNTKNKDALHLAAAMFGNCNYFITCEDKFVKTICFKIHLNFQFGHLNPFIIPINFIYFNYSSSILFLQFFLP